MNTIEIYDTTLRDGGQDPDVEFSLKDKIEIAKVVDAMGVDYIELGWPHPRNPKERDVYKAIKDYEIKAKIATFGSTRKKGISVFDDPDLITILETETPVAAIFGKSWTEHVTNQLKMSLDENIEAIYGSVKFLKANGREVIFDAEHFFDGFKDDSSYALQCIHSAFEAGADRLVLCDTNGGSFQWEIRYIATKAIDSFREKGLLIGFGIHCHNDGGLGVANSLEFARLANSPEISPYIVQIQGTFNGFGERIGNADLVQIVAGLYRMGIWNRVASNLKSLTSASENIYEIAGIRPNKNQPYVGENAGRHKAGVHVDGITKGARYDFFDLKKVGSESSVVLSDQSGGANIVIIAREFGYDVAKSDPRVVDALDEFKKMQYRGYNNGGIEAEKFLLVEKHFGKGKEYFSISNHRIIDENGISTCELTGTVNSHEETVKKSIRGGPVDATYHSLQELLHNKYSNIDGAELNDYRVKILDDKGSGATVRVWCEFKCRSNNKINYWETIGVSDDIIKASREAIEKGFRYYLMKSEK